MNACTVFEIGGRGCTVMLQHSEHMQVQCPEIEAYGFELADESRRGHGLACAGHALRLRTEGLVRRMWTCSPSMV